MDILNKNSLRLSVLDDAVIDDEVFADAAIELLRTEQPNSTYTMATAGMALIDHLMIERIIDCYERGQVTDAASGTILPDANGDYGTAINIVNHSRYVNSDELTKVIKKLGLPLPKILKDLTFNFRR